MAWQAKWSQSSCSPQRIPRNTTSRIRAVSIVIFLSREIQLKKILCSMCMSLITVKHIHTTIYKIGLPWWLRWQRICLQCRRPGLGRSSGEGNGYPIQYSCLENSMNRGLSLEGYNHWGCKESERTEWLGLCALTHTHSQQGPTIYIAQGTT